jgi:hypothetical protein
LSNPAKQLGTQLESAIVGWLKQHGWPFAHRRTQKGSPDEGDVCLSERIPFTIEAKNSRRTTERAAIGTWLRELETEVTNVGDEAGAVIHKRRGTTDVGEYVAIMPVKYLNHLLTLAYESELGIPSSPRARRRVIPRLDT